MLLDHEHTSSTHRLVIAVLAIGPAACGYDSNATSDATDIAPGPPSCGTAITINVPGPGVTVDTCSGYKLDVPSCGGAYAKAVVVKFVVTPQPGVSGWIVPRPNGKWLSPLDFNCRPRTPCAQSENYGFLDQQLAFVEEPTGSCGSVTITTQAISAVTSSGLPVESLDGVDEVAPISFGHVVEER